MVCVATARSSLMVTRKLFRSLFGCRARGRKVSGRALQGLAAWLLTAVAVCFDLILALLVLYDRTGHPATMTRER